MAVATAAYDEHADWYDEHMSADGASAYVQRVHDTLSGLLGPGTGTCLDVCCGTGAHVRPLAGLGWTPVGVDLSRNQLRHAAARLPVAVADATALPLADGSVPAAVCVLASTDVPDYAAVLREIGRVLAPGGRFVHLGVHPCFVGAFAERVEVSKVVLDGGYADRARRFDGNPAGVRVRVGAWHTPLADLLNAVTAAGLRLVRTAEAGEGGIPELFGFAAVKDCVPVKDYAPVPESVPVPESPPWQRGVEKRRAPTVTPAAH
ncbi:class I SAM-dependent methyltransferase [Streptomyces sp. CA-249302]|uniref:class I SAM-dependent methyltransferase n=1 Tax=Streptomyces sp. CA-249302 TaxID=3240058 RepID=UPI003D8C84B5